MSVEGRIISFEISPERVRPGFRIHRGVILREISREANANQSKKKKKRRRPPRDHLIEFTDGSKTVWPSEWLTWFDAPNKDLRVREAFIWKT